MFQAKPTASSGLRVGLLGGSFNPAHQGHLHISKTAMRRLGLDRVWWLLSPGNPLKPRPPAPLAKRIDAACRLIDHPRIIATDIESRLGTRFTLDTIRALTEIYPEVRFVWLMGADNLAQFHQWDRWPQIMTRVPIAVLARPGQQLRAGLSPAARRFARYRLPPQAAPVLPLQDAPCWTMLTHPMSPLSSTQIRKSGAW